MRLLLSVLACTDPAPVSAPPPAPPPPATDAAPEVFTLVGRAAHEGLLVPTLVGGRALLGTDCATVNAALGGKGPPCLAERWRSDRREALFLVADPVATLTWGGDVATPARTRWPCLGAALGTCLEDPLMVPPARDPGGERRFTGDTWELHFSGQNRCGLGGVLVLEVARDHGVWAGLTVDGIPWGAGGRGRAHEHAEALLRPR